MHIQNPFEIIIDRLNAIQTKVGDIDTIVRSGNLPTVRKSGKKKVSKASTATEIKKEGVNG